MPQTSPNFLLIGICVVAALGGFVYGVDSGIIATTIGHDTFKEYMYGPSKSNASLTGAIVSLYNAGQAIGSGASSWSADRFSRKYTVACAGILAALGGALQAGAAHVAMMIVGRLFAGIACGVILSTVPIYLAEIAPAESRGFMVGLQGMMIAIGFATANWIGYGGAFGAGQVQWRVPLAMQCPGAIALTVGCLFVPFSPRWLCKQERYEEAKNVIARLHKTENCDYVESEYAQIFEQLALEREQGDANWGVALGQLFSKRYLRRTSTACFIIAMSQLSGSTVIQNYQSIFYQMVGFTGKTSLLTSGVYGMMGVIGQVIYLLVVADKWRRTTTLWTGSLFLCVMVSICMALSAKFGTGDAGDKAGARGAIASIFIYSAGYAIFFNAMVWVVPSELFPFFLRAKGLGLAVFTKAVVAIVLAQITPVALEEVGWRYYALFISTNLAAAVIYYFFLPETGGKTLEEISELFGDVVAENPLNIRAVSAEYKDEKDRELRSEHREN